MITMWDFFWLQKQLYINWQKKKKRNIYWTGIYWNYYDRDLLKSLWILLGNLSFCLCIHSPKQESKASKFTYKIIREVQTFSGSPRQTNWSHIIYRWRCKDAYSIRGFLYWNISRGHVFRNLNSASKVNLICIQSRKEAEKLSGRKRLILWTLEFPIGRWLE